MWIFQAIKLNNVELPIYLDYYDLIQQKKKTESQSPSWQRLVWLLGV